MKDIFKKHSEFVHERFPDHTVEGHMNKLEEEVSELREAIQDYGNSYYPAREELADILLVCFSMADSMGMSYEHVCSFMKAKIIKNNTRRWEKQPDGTYKHQTA